jgi:hypothetical protein
MSGKSPFTTTEPNEYEIHLEEMFFALNELGEGYGAGVLAGYRSELLAPIVALARKQLETGSAVSGGTSLAIKILELAGEK